MARIKYFGKVTKITKLRFAKILYIHTMSRKNMNLPYSISTERIFDRPFIYNKTFLNKLLQMLVAHIYTLLLAPFAFKLVNYLRHSETFES